MPGRWRGPANAEPPVRLTGVTPDLSGLEITGLRGVVILEILIDVHGAVAQACVLRQPTRQASRVMMRHSDVASGVGGTMDATGGSADRCAGRQLPLPTATTVASHSVRQAF